MHFPVIVPQIAPAGDTQQVAFVPSWCTYQQARAKGFNFWDSDGDICSPTIAAFANRLRRLRTK